MVKKLVFCIFATISSNVIITSDGAINLPAIIGLIDGTFVGIGAEEVRKIIDVIRNITGIQLGEKNEGKFTFRTNKYSIKELAEIEKKEGLTSELKNVLDIVKERCCALMKSWIEDAEGAKELTYELMVAWAEENGRSNSLLLDWGKEPEGTELTYFNEHFNSFIQLDEFCTDLRRFLHALLKSCPKAFAEYRQRYGNKK